MVGGGSGQTLNYLGNFREAFDELERWWRQTYSDSVMFQRRSSSKSSRVA